MHFLTHHSVRNQKYRRAIARQSIWRCSSKSHKQPESRKHSLWRKPAISELKRNSTQRDRGRSMKQLKRQISDCTTTESNPQETDQWRLTTKTNYQPRTRCARGTGQQLTWNCRESFHQVDPKTNLHLSFHSRSSECHQSSAKPTQKPNPVLLKDEGWTASQWFTSRQTKTGELKLAGKSHSLS